MKRRAGPPDRHQAAWLWLVLIGLLGSSLAARAQIVDDSTKVIYGPKTTRVIYEQEILRDSTQGTLIDTSLTRFPQVRYWFHDTTFQQDLGAVGTASRPLLYQNNVQLGARYGRNAFDRYARRSATIPYYDTRSPYSFFRVLQSGEGEQVFEFNISRSLRETFSIGANFERIASNKILAAQSSREGLVEHTNVLIYGRYQTDNERYHLVFNYNNVRHDAAEQGGIRPLPGEETLRDLFNYDRQSVYLTTAKNTEDRDQFHLTQSYRLLGRGLTVYYTFDALRQYNSYSDTRLATTVVTRSYGTPPDTLNTRTTVPLFYPRVLRNTTATLDRAEYKQVENTLGVLGRTQAVEYRLYARLRDAALTTQTLLPTPANTTMALGAAAPSRHLLQGFVGGTAAFNYRRIYAVETAGELYILPLSGLSVDSYRPEFWARAAVRTGPLSGEVLLNSYSPTLTQQEFIGNHYQWSHWSGNYFNSLTNRVDETFSNTSTRQLTGRLQLPLPDFSVFTGQRLDVGVSAVNISNLVYYGTSGLPQQISAARNLLIANGRHQVMLGRFGFDNQATYTRGGDVEGLRIPQLVSFSRVYYQSLIFKKALLSQVGAELYFQARYRPFDYSPSTQQFYQQDHFTSRSFGVANVFFAADIKTVNVFLKVAYVNQGLPNDGYFVTPYYTGYPRRFQLGVRWNFYN